MLVKEYRIPLPLTVDEFHIGQLYAVSACSRNETGGGEGAEFLKQEDFTSTSILPGKKLTGIYTYKIYRLRSKAPWVLQKLLPPEAFEIHEESWNAYPYCKTVLTNPGYMKNNFMQTIETIHLADNGQSENPLNAPKNREIVYIDICDEKIYGRNGYNKQRDPTIFKSKKTGRGPLEDEWIDNHEPIMCAYKLVSIHFKWTGFQTLIEKTIHKQYPKVFGIFHRDAYAWIDVWHDMSLEDIRRFEEETAQILRKQIEEPEKRGTNCDDDNNNK
ncbi:unnamed protein product [Caenorhabditis bovis]|uniref:Phosphatidylinositol transfer protein N-terminal domain-containing protein n=1 Tax=Caenorhabditis bovis TaxID=2654633 RepID=A0A8S1F6F3_9PELO|nr:unnamed protein product [Caenorhabditis bovis]